MEIISLSFSSLADAIHMDRTNGAFELATLGDSADLDLDTRFAYLDAAERIVSGTESHEDLLSAACLLSAAALEQRDRSVAKRYLENALRLANFRK